MGVVVALIGFTSTFALVLQGFRAVGADEAQAASGLMAVAVCMGLSGIWLSWTRRMPISVAWSTPGAALMINSGASSTGYDAAVGAFLMSAVLLIAAGAFRPLARLAESIPSNLANAMLAGILLGICLAPARAMAEHALLAGPVILAWWIAGRINRFVAVPVAFVILIVMVAWQLGFPEDLANRLAAAAVPAPVLVMPRLDLQTLIGIGLPLFVVTMASQNVPGIAVQRAYGYTPPAGPLIVNTGGFSLLAAPFGGHAVNLAALTAALCAGPDSHAEPERRYWTAIVAGVVYVFMGLTAGVVSVLVILVPASLIEAVAGLALLGAMSAALVAAFRDTELREAAAVTFIFSASGIAFLGVGGAFWGLLAGSAMHAVHKRKLTKTPAT
jgi:benzoate membrane transport protein